LQAVHTSGHTQIPIVSSSDAVQQALQSIKNGTGIIATNSTDAFWDGSAGLAMGYCAATGKLDPSSVPTAKRSFNAQEFTVSKDDVDKYLATPNPADYQNDWNCKNLWNRFVSPSS